MADARYEIDILARMTGGAEAVSQINAMADGLTNAAGPITAYDSAVEQASAAVQESGRVYESINTQLEMATQKYSAMVRDAERAERAVDRVQAAGKDASALVASAEAAKAAIQKEAEALSELQRKAAAAKDVHEKLGQSLKKLEGAQKGAASEAARGGQSIEQMTYLAKGALGPMGGLFERGTMLAKGLGQFGLAAAALAAAAAFAVLASAIVAGLAEMVRFAIATGDAAIKANALLQGATGSAAAAGELGDMIARVASRSPQAADGIAKIATKLYQSGKRGAELERAILEASYAAEGLGKNPGPELVAQRMANLDAQATKFKEHLAQIFAGAKTVDAVSKFERGLLKLNDLWGENTASGRALQTLVSTIVTPLINGITAAMPLAQELFRGMVLGAMRVVIAALKVYIALKQMIGGESISKMLAVVDVMKVGEYAFYAVIAVLGVLAVAAFAAVAAFLLIPAAMLAVVAAGAALVYAIGLGISYLWELGGAAVSAAGEFIAGLAGGITAGAGVVYDAIRNMANGAIATLKSALGIASPSKVAMLAGGFTAEGFAEGVDRNAPAAASAVERLGNVSGLGGGVGGSAGERATGVGGSAGGNVVTINIDASGGDADSIAAAVRRVLVDVLEGAVIQVGGSPA